MLPLAIAGVIYILLLTGYALYSVYAFHHLNEFGYSADTSSQMLRIYLGLSLFIILIAIVTVVLGLTQP
jgi:hypothetical protein